MNQLGELQKHYSEFRKFGAEMYGISVDAPDVSKRNVVQRLGVRFTILSDESRETIKAYGVHDRISNIAKPATFIVDKDGVIRWKDVGEHKADRVFSDEVIQQLTALNQSENTPPRIEFELTVPEGLSLFHLPLAVTSVNGQSRTVERVSDLFDLLGGSANVYWLITTHTGAPKPISTVRYVFA